MLLSRATIGCHINYLLFTCACFCFFFASLSRAFLSFFPSVLYCRHSAFVKRLRRLPFPCSRVHWQCVADETTHRTPHTAHTDEPSAITRTRLCFNSCGLCWRQVKCDGNTIGNRVNRQLTCVMYCDSKPLNRLHTSSRQHHQRCVPSHCCASTGTISIGIDMHTESIM